MEGGVIGLADLPVVSPASLSLQHGARHGAERCCGRGGGGVPGASRRRKRARVRSSVAGLGRGTPGVPLPVVARVRFRGKREGSRGVNVARAGAGDEGSSGTDPGGSGYVLSPTLFHPRRPFARRSSQPLVRFQPHPFPNPPRFSLPLRRKGCLPPTRRRRRTQRYPPLDRSPAHKPGEGHSTPSMAHLRYLQPSNLGRPRRGLRHRHRRLSRAHSHHGRRRHHGRARVQAGDRHADVMRGTARV